MSGPSSLPLAGLAPRRVPEAYVRAEVASFPLTSMGAFQRAMMELNPWVGEKGEEGVQEGKTFVLWRECERMLVEHASGWSLDRIIAVRDFFWFGCKPGPARSAPRRSSLLQYLRRLSEEHLQARPGVTQLAQDPSGSIFEAIAHYRWLTFALPEDLLLAASRSEPPPTRVEIEQPLMVRRLLDQGVAEIHHHVNSGMDFPLLWASAMAALADPLLRPDVLKSPELPFEDSERLLRWMLAAAVARRVLAEFLIRRRDEPSFTLAAFLRKLRTDSAPRTDSAWLPGRSLVPLLQALRALALGLKTELPGFYVLHGLYGDLHPDWHDDPLRELPARLDEAWERCDPITVRLNLGKTPNAGERWLIRHALAYLEELEAERREDNLFARVFWQGLRVRCLLFRAVVQRPMTAGLQWFIRFYDRIGGLRRPLKNIRPEVSYRTAGGAHGALAALEIRTGPDESAEGIAETLADFTTSWMQVLSDRGSHCGGLREPEFGVVFHFVKDRDPVARWKEGRPPAFGLATYAEPQPPGRVRLGGRYSDFFTEQSGRARALAELLRAVPQALWLVRGLDMTADELSVPTWVMVPLYRFVQSEAAYATVDPRAEDAPPLRLTAHVGEDFRHLMEGLRRIYECIVYILDRAGGRLGHAIALGMEPRLWAESVGSVMMSVEERLWDLVFEWRVYSGYRVPPEFRAEAPAGRAEQLTNWIRELSQRIFGHSYEPEMLAEVHDVLHRLFVPPVSRAPPGVGLDSFTRALETMDPEQVQSPLRVKRILRRHLEDEETFRRGQELIDISLDPLEIAGLYAVQNALRRGVGIRGIVVEVNPSSNLLIGDLLDLRSHPLLRLFPPVPEPGGPPPVPIAVGSDDPITFSTFLLREYALLYEAGLTAGYPERVVVDWLATIRQTGLDARFTVAWLPTAWERARRLVNDFDDFLRRPRRTEWGQPRPAGRGAREADPAHATP